MSGAAPVHALVLAGRRAGESEPIARHAGVPVKALAVLAGRAMIEYPLAVLRDSPRIGAIEIALPAAAGAAWQAHLAAGDARARLRCVAPASSPARSVLAALERLPRGAALLVTTADHALLDAAMLDQFLDRCVAPQVDVFAGLLPLALLEARYPDMRRTGIRLRDGRYSGCNLFLLRNRDGARALLAFWQRLEALRKSPLRMARAVGPRMLIGYGLGLLTLARALHYLGQRSGARLGAALLDIPEAAVDVDSLRDLAFVEGLLAARRRPPA